MTPSRARRAFSRKLAEFVVWAWAQGYEIAFDEGRVLNPRKVRKAGIKVLAQDAVHMPESLHYLGLACDFNLYRGDDYIEDGGDPAWTAMGVRWEQMGKESGLDLRWGGRFDSVDSNHFSLAFGGKA